MSSQLKLTLLLLLSAGISGESESSEPLADFTKIPDPVTTGLPSTSEPPNIPPTAEKVQAQEGPKPFDVQCNSAELQKDLPACAAQAQPAAKAADNDSGAEVVVADSGEKPSPSKQYGRVARCVGSDKQQLYLCRQAFRCADDGKLEADGELDCAQLDGSGLLKMLAENEAKLKRQLAKKAKKEASRKIKKRERKLAKQQRKRKQAQKRQQRRKQRQLKRKNKKGGRKKKRTAKISRK